MSISIIISFLTYTIITAVTPGPNNILALNATINYAYKDARKLLLGIYTGFACVMLVCGVGSSLFAKFLPSIMIYLKYIGVAYIVYLAYKVALSKPPQDEKSEIIKRDSTLSFKDGFLLQFINIKIIIYGITIFATFVFPFYQSWGMVMLFVVISSVIGISGTGVWVISGIILKRFLQKYYKIVNVIMALMLVFSAVQILLYKEI